MGDHYDYVIVDSAPVLPVSDSAALAGSVVGVLVVVQAGRATDEIVFETIERLYQASHSAGPTACDGAIDVDAARVVEQPRGRVAGPSHLFAMFSVSGPPP